MYKPYFNINYEAIKSTVTT